MATTFRVPWPHDGARELQVTVEPDVPPNHPIEQRVRSASAIASSHSGLLYLLEAAVGNGYEVAVGATLDEVTLVELKRLQKEMT